MAILFMLSLVRRIGDGNSTVQALARNDVEHLHWLSAINPI